MAAKKKKKSGKSDKLLIYKKLFAGVAMMSFMVIIISGLKAEVSLATITYRAMAVMFVVYVISRIILKVLSGYEEMNSGKV